MNTKLLIKKTINYGIYPESENEDFEISASDHIMTILASHGIIKSIYTHTISRAIIPQILMLSDIYGIDLDIDLGIQQNTITKEEVENWGDSWCDSFGIDKYIKMLILAK